MKVLRTPDERFENLPGYDFAPNYLFIDDGEGGKLRVHYLDEGSREGQVVLLMHGEPTWSFLYRKMIPVLVGAGLRVIAPDLVGFGRSDKPAALEDYSYQRHVTWMRSVVSGLGLRDITLVAQDWGGLIGLRVVAADPQLFARVVVANTGLPTGDQTLSQAFYNWQKFSREAESLPIGHIVAGGCTSTLPDDVIAAYDAPFPDDSYKAGARQFPSLVPTRPDDPAAQANRDAWSVLREFDKPMLTAFSDKDPVTKGAERPFQKYVPGAQGREHVTIQGAGHFLQEDAGELLAQTVANFVAST